MPDASVSAYRWFEVAHRIGRTKRAVHLPFWLHRRLGVSSRVMASRVDRTTPLKVKGTSFYVSVPGWVLSGLFRLGLYAGPRAAL